MTKSNPHVVPRGDQWACSEKALTGHPRCTQPKLMPSMLAAVSLKTSVANSSSIGRMVRFVTGTATAMTRFHHGTRRTDGDGTARVREQTWNNLIEAAKGRQCRAMCVVDASRNGLRGARSTAISA